MRIVDNDEKNPIPTEIWLADIVERDPINALWRTDERIFVEKDEIEKVDV